MSEELSDLGPIENHQIILGKKHSEQKKDTKPKKKKTSKRIKRNQKKDEIDYSIEINMNDNKENEREEEEEEESEELQPSNDGDENKQKFIISLSGKKNIEDKNQAENQNKQEKPKKKRKKNIDYSIELKESDSKEYVEEGEESDELEDNNDSDEDEEFSRSKIISNKKRKLEENNQAPGWERTWKDNNSENDNKSISSSSAVVVNIKKNDKNKDENYNEKINDNRLKNESMATNNFIYSKKTSFIITSPENNNNKSMQNIHGKNFINPNRNNLSNNQYREIMGNPEYQNPEINNQNNSEKKYFFSNNSPSYIPNIQQHSLISQSTDKAIRLPIPLMFQGHKICKFMGDKYKKYGMNLSKIDHLTMLNILSKCLEKYIRTYLLRLITISRIRNANFHLYSNNPNGQNHYKFRTFNCQLTEDKKNFSFIKGKNLDILFTSNLKHDMDLIEEYVELNNKKIKFEKLSSVKEKDEENEKAKGIESSIKITEGPNPTIKLLPGRRTKKKNNSFIKEVRKKLVQTQKKEDQIKQNSNTKNTLDAFLDDTDIGSKNKNKGKNSINSLLDDSKMSNRVDFSSRMSDNMSNMFSYTNNIGNNAKNEIDMNVFNNFDPTKNILVPRGQKRRINIKDFIYMMENSNEYIPRKKFILNKASFEHLKKYN